MTYEPDSLASWFILTLCRSSSKVKVIDHVTGGKNLLKRSARPRVRAFLVVTNVCLFIILEKK